ncbi:hypothetical protein JCM18899A_55320 [Nocardioides sp. AN3]
MYQRAYIARRKPGMSKEEFITHWVSHYDVALGIEEFWPTVRVYVQNDVLPEGLPGAPEVSVGYDAVGEFIYEDQAACRANVDARVNGGHAADVAVAHADEFITWEPYTGNFGGEIIELGGVNRAPFKLFRCFARAEGTGYGTFETVLKRSAVAVGAGASLTIGETSTLPFTPAGLVNPPFEAVFTVWFNTLEEVSDFLAGDWWKSFYETTGSVADPEASLVLVARENVVHDPPQLGGTGGGSATAMDPIGRTKAVAGS